MNHEREGDRPKPKIYTNAEIQNGGSQVFTQFFEACNPKFLRFAVSLTKNIDRAEDMVQKSWLKYVEKLQEGTLKPDGNSEVYLLRSITHNIIDNSRRVFTRYNAKVNSDTVEETGVPRRQMSGHPVSSADIAEGIHSKVIEERFYELVAILPAQQKLIMVLDYLGYTEKEKAEIACCGKGAVKSHLSRARSRMKLLLDKEDLQ